MDIPTNLSRYFKICLHHGGLHNLVLLWKGNCFDNRSTSAFFHAWVYYRERNCFYIKWNTGLKL